MKLLSAVEFVTVEWVIVITLFLKLKTNSLVSEVIPTVNAISLFLIISVLNMIGVK